MSNACLSVSHVLEFTCGKCCGVLSIPTERAGSSGPCPFCGHRIDAPSVDLPPLPTKIDQSVAAGEVSPSLEVVSDPATFSQPPVSTFATATTFPAKTASVGDRNGTVQMRSGSRRAPLATASSAAMPSRNPRSNQFASETRMRKIKAIFAVAGTIACVCAMFALTKFTSRTQTKAATMPIENSAEAVAGETVAKSR